jgi:hypothetical protein
MGISFHAFLSILVAKQHFVGPYCLSTRLLITCQGLTELAIIHQKTGKPVSDPQGQTPDETTPLVAVCAFDSQKKIKDAQP